MAAPLAGIVVVEAAQIISGPLAGMLLALQGADVIKVEPPGVGDPTRLSGDRAGGVGVMFANCNRGKRSVVLDATDPQGRELVAALADRADVFTQNFRPGKAAKMGLGPAALLARNSALVYASIYGYGPDGPYAADKVYDFVIQAVSGLAASQRGQDDDRPRLVRNYVMDKATSYHTAQAITAALLARERDPERRGQHLELSMLDVGLEFVWPEGMMEHTYLDPSDRIPLSLDFYDTYPTRDGALALYPIIPGSFEGLCRACGHPEWTEDERFAQVFDRRRNMAAFVHLVAEALAGMTTADALARLGDHDVAVAEVVPLAEVHQHPQVRHNQSLVDRVDPLVGPVRVPRHAARFERTPAEPPGDVPAHGQHTVEVLTGLGLSEADIVDLQERGVAGGPHLHPAGRERPVRFGFTLPNNWGLADPAGLVGLAPLAEAAGFDSVWVNHHLLNVGYVADRLGDDRPYYDALTTLTWAAALTQRVRLGTSVLVVPYLSPFVTAKALATLDQLTGGRVECGIGVGSLPEEHRVVSPVPFGARGRYADEFLAVMVALWTEDRPSFAGEFFRFEGAPASPRPRQQPHPPLVVGGNKPAALRRTARFGQGWHALAPSPEGMAQRLEALDEALAAVGRSRAELVISLRADLHLLDSPAADDGRGAGLRGDAAQVAERVERYGQLGVEELVVSVPSGDLDHQRRQLETFAERVMPQLRR